MLLADWVTEQKEVEADGASPFLSWTQESERGKKTLFCPQIYKQYKN